MQTYAVPAPPEMGEMIYVFRRDVAHLRKSVEQYEGAPGGGFVPAAWGLVGVAAAGVVALIAYYASTPRPSPWAATLFWALVAAGVFAAAACFWADHVFSSARKKLRATISAELNELEYGGRAAAMVSPTGKQQQQQQQQH